MILLVIGLVLRLALPAHISVVNVHAIGDILIAAGVVSLSLKTSLAAYMLKEQKTRPRR